MILLQRNERTDDRETVAKNTTDVSVALEIFTTRTTLTANHFSVSSWAEGGGGWFGWKRRQYLMANKSVATACEQTIEKSTEKRGNCLKQQLQRLNARFICFCNIQVMLLSTQFDLGGWKEKERKKHKKRKREGGRVSKRNSSSIVAQSIAISEATLNKIALLNTTIIAQTQRSIYSYSHSGCERIGYALGNVASHCCVPYIARVSRINVSTWHTYEKPGIFSYEFQGRTKQCVCENSHQ